MAILVVAVKPEEVTSAVLRSVVTCAKSLKEDIDLLVFSRGVDEVASFASKIAGIREVLIAEGNLTAPEQIADAVKEIASGYSHIFFSSTVFARTVMPRVAALLDVPALSEVCEVLSEKTFRRYIYAGSLLATVAIEVTPVVATVRQSAFEPAALQEEETSQRVLSFTSAARTFEVVEASKSRKTDAVDLESAKIVVGAGRGVIDEAGFRAAKELAEKLHGAIGSTRAMVDAFIAPADTQVGQTGKIIAPDLYFAFGISGAIQHLAGMKDAKTIVAVNNDPEAPIIEVCDYWLEADAVETIEELIRKL